MRNDGLWRSFLVLLPRALLSDPLGADYEQYVHDAQRHYQLWLDVTSAHQWRAEGASSTHSYDSRPEADLHLACPESDDDAGPFLRTLLELVRRMPDQPYQLNLHLTAVLSKLALVPHAALHNFLLSPDRELYAALSSVAQRLATEIPRIKNYKTVLENTRMQLMSEDPTYDEIGEHDRPVEGLIVLEEFCKELAAIAFVKFQHEALTQA